MNKQSFPIPEGCKAVTVEKVGNQIITTFELIKKERWRAEKGKPYYSFGFGVFTSVEDFDNTDNYRHDNGFNFQTEAQAQRAADRLKAELYKFWEEELRF